MPEQCAVHRQFEHTFMLGFIFGNPPFLGPYNKNEGSENFGANGFLG